MEDEHLGPKFASPCKGGGVTGGRGRRIRTSPPYKLNPVHQRQSEKSRSDHAFRLIRRDETRRIIDRFDDRTITRESVDVISRNLKSLDASLVHFITQTRPHSQVSLPASDILDKVEQATPSELADIVRTVHSYIPRANDSVLRQPKLKNGSSVRQYVRFCLLVLLVFGVCIVAAGPGHVEKEAHFISAGVIGNMDLHFNRTLVAMPLNFTIAAEAVAKLGEKWSIWSPDDAPVSVFVSPEIHLNASCEKSPASESGAIETVGLAHHQGSYCASHKYKGGGIEISIWTTMKTNLTSTLFHEMVHARHFRNMKSRNVDFNRVTESIERFRSKFRNENGFSVDYTQDIKTFYDNYASHNHNEFVVGVWQAIINDSVDIPLLKEFVAKNPILRSNAFKILAPDEET